MQPSSIIKILLIVLFLFLPRADSHGQSAQPNTPQLELSLEVVGTIVHAGDPLRVRVEIKNNGPDAVPVARSLINNRNGAAYLGLEFRDANGNTFLEAALNGWRSARAEGTWWTMVASGHYYGIEDTLGNEELPTQLKNSPGRYEVTARYVSKGGIVPPSREDWGIPAIDAWKGELKSNSVWIEVLPRPEAESKTK